MIVQVPPFMVMGTRGRDAFSWNWRRGRRKIEFVKRGENGSKREEKERVSVSVSVRVETKSINIS